MTYKSILLDKQKHVAVLSLNRPQKMNSLDDELLDEVTQALDHLEKETEVRVLIIRAEGRAFCAGFDISPREKPFSSVQDWREHVALGNDLFNRIWRSPIVVIAAVQGYCLGGGCELAMVCDLTLAAADAEFGEPQILFKSAPPYAIMPWVIGMKKSKELLFTGDRIGAEEAERIGLVNRVVEPEQLMAEAHKLAAKLVMIPPPALAMNKHGMNKSYEMRGFQSTIEYGGELFTLVLMSESPEAAEFRGMVEQKGVKEALKWRAERLNGA